MYQTNHCVLAHFISRDYLLYGPHQRNLGPIQVGDLTGQIRAARCLKVGFMSRLSRHVGHNLRL
eukprot:1157826-Pelagomonas_calceolata.AAC.3